MRGGQNVLSGRVKERSRVYFEGVTCSSSQDADRLQETTTRKVGEVNAKLQAEHILVIDRVCIDEYSKLCWWDLLGKFDGLGDSVVTRLDRALDFRVRFFTACSVEGKEPFDKRWE